MKLRFYSLIIFIVVAFFNQRFFRYGIVFNIGTNWRVVDVLLLLLFIVMFITPGGKNSLIKNDGWLNKNIVILIFILIIAIFRGFLVSGAYALGIGRYSLLDFFIIPVIVNTIDSYSKMIKMFNIIIITVVSSVIMYSVVNLNLFPLLFQADRYGRFIDSYTVIGYASVLLLCISFNVLEFPSKLKPSLQLFKNKSIIIFLTIFIVIIQHRSVWVSLFGGLLFFSSITFLKKGSTSNKGKKRFFLLLILAGIFFLISIYVYSDFFNDLLFNRLKFLGGLDKDPNGYWRLLSWQNSINETIKNHLLFGNGFKQFIWTDRYGTTVRVWEHNQYVTLFRTTGLVGLFFYITFIINSIRLSLKNIKSFSSEGKVFMLGLSLVLICNAIYMLFYAQVIFLFITVGLILSVIKIEERRKSQFVAVNNIVKKQ